jgi:predicted DNA binding CopG/RHH family protein
VVAFESSAQESGENLGDYTMKKPNLKKLRVDEATTKQIRSAMAQHRSIKITININADTLEKLKAIAEQSGVPYQRLINRTLTESLATNTLANSRLDKVEKELAALKRKLAP